ncbi:hypothetical protein [Spiroplasma endosymbiont of Zeiraphera isertana]|uniref:hypothetical protein n=1 Tax=Spiroplasma endosymbiont of Zeiraphera isertana TaxID=3066313 RepID=UPI00313D3DE2
MWKLKEKSGAFATSVTPGAGVIFGISPNLNGELNKEAIVIYLKYLRYSSPGIEENNVIVWNKINTVEIHVATEREITDLLK